MAPSDPTPPSPAPAGAARSPADRAPADGPAAVAEASDDDKLTPKEWLALLTRGALLVFVLGLAVQAIVHDHEPALPSGQAAPALPLRSYDGVEWDLSRYAGQPVFVNFWASWCTPCLAEMPGLVRASNELGERLPFVGATVQSDPDEVFAVLRKLSVPYAIAAVSAETAERWRAPMLPASYLLNARHEIVWSVQGPVSEDELHDAIRDHLPRL